MAARMNSQINSLKERRDVLRRDILSLEGELRGLEHALSVLEGSDSGVSIQAAARQPRGAMKDIVLRFLDENQDHGLIAAEIVEMAKKQGHLLDRNSVSSLLSRLKQENVLSHEGGRYRPVNLRSRGSQAKVVDLPRSTEHEAA